VAALLLHREAHLLTRLGADMSAVPAASFDTWMKQRSDLVQDTAEAYVSREVVGAGQRALEGVSSALHTALSRVLLLDALCRVRAHLAWYLVEGLLSAAGAKEVGAGMGCGTVDGWAWRRVVWRGEVQLAPTALLS